MFIKFYRGINSISCLIQNRPDNNNSYSWQFEALYYKTLLKDPGITEISFTEFDMIHCVPEARILLGKIFSIDSIKSVKFHDACFDIAGAPNSFQDLLNIVESGKIDSISFENCLDIDIAVLLKYVEKNKADLKILEISQTCLEGKTENEVPSDKDFNFSDTKLLPDLKDLCQKYNIEFKLIRNYPDLEPVSLPRCTM